MKPNFELLNQVLDHIRLSPEAHDQDVWRYVSSCNTQLCFAGWTCQLAGGRWVEDTALLRVEPDDDLNDVRVLGSFALMPHAVRDASLATPVIMPAIRARRLLNLDHETTHELFYRCNDLDDLERTVKRLENEWRDEVA